MKHQPTNQSFVGMHFTLKKDRRMYCRDVWRIVWIFIIHFTFIGTLFRAMTRIRATFHLWTSNGIRKAEKHIGSYVMWQAMKIQITESPSFFFFALFFLFVTFFLSLFHICSCIFYHSFFVLFFSFSSFQCLGWSRREIICNLPERRACVSPL